MEKYFKISYLLTYVICVCNHLFRLILRDCITRSRASFVKVEISKNSKTRRAKGIVEWKKENYAFAWAA